MSRPELSQTLIALVGAVPLDGGGTVLEVDLEVPMEIVVARRGAGLVVEAVPAHTRFLSGFMMPVHMARLHIVAGPADPAAPATSADGWISPW